MDNWEIALSVMVGVGLSAACGFRVFIPPLVLCVAGKAGQMSFGPDFAWMTSDVALAAFGLAAALEVGPLGAAQGRFLDGEIQLPAGSWPLVVLGLWGLASLVLMARLALAILPSALRAMFTRT